MELHRLEGRSSTGIAEFGCIWNKGELTKADSLRAVDAAGAEVLLQSRITAWHSDGSVKWTAHSADAEQLGELFSVEKCAADTAHPALSCVSEKDDAACGKDDSRYVTNGKPCAVSHENKNTDACGASDISDSKNMQPAGVEESDRQYSENHNIPQLSWNGGELLVKTAAVSFVAHAHGTRLITEYCIGETCRMEELASVLRLEHRSEEGGAQVRRVTELAGEITALSVEEQGPVRFVLKYEGIHKNSEEEKIPFVLRLSFDKGLRSFRFQYTFAYDGTEETDFLKGIGLRAVTPASGAIYNRHIRFLGDAGSFSESSANLLTWRPRVPFDIYEAQCRGEAVHPEGEALETVNTVIAAMPYWDTYEIVQDAPNHFSIAKKQAGEGLCYIDCLHGNRADGGLSVGSEGGGALMFAMRDFWQTYPSGYTVSGMSGDAISVTAWFYSPAAEAYDFRHYANRGYNQSYYEGYDFKGASAYGIAVTSEGAFAFADEMCADEAKLSAFSQETARPAVYVGTPEFYHSRRAFGYWSLPKQDTETGRWLEQQLDEAVRFYEREVDQRNWYGLFNYGDFMHTYDRFRHVWRYDMGGYAWDNTELVPTLWLWQMFMRSGRGDVFDLAERLSRHASEVDVYHFGKYKGLGSRHNVRHWGCPCKEARIAMAAHHRYFYYMTGDHRMEDIFDELKDNELTFLNKDPLGEFYDKDKMLFPSHARSGPDWSSLCANWMTQWERTLDNRYLEKIKTGSKDIENAPLRLVSGPDFEFDPKTCHLRYIGERTTGGTHLQICMGAPSVWMEMADMMADETWKDMIAEYGRFYYLPHDLQQKLSGGLVGDREFSLPFMAAAMGAYGAERLKDAALARTTWRILLHAMCTEQNTEGFAEQILENRGNQKELHEIAWISTNFTAQWCLNVIMSLEFIRDSLPKTMEDLRAFLKDMPEAGWRKA